MQDSSYEGIYIGIYILVFVTAISVSVFLFKGIYDFSEIAFEYKTQVLSENIAVNAPVNKYRLINGDEVVSYFFNYIKHDIYGSYSKNQPYVIRIKNRAGNVIVSSDVNTEIIKSYATLVGNIKTDKKYKVEYVSEDIAANKIYIDIIEASDEEVNEML